MVKKWIVACVGLFMLMLQCGSADVWSISDDNLQVDFDDQKVVFTVKDKNSGMTWQQAAAKDKFTVENVKKIGKQLTISLKGKVDLDIDMDLLRGRECRP